ncbi:STAS domain-containing protein [Streptomyces sp. WAC06614]|uniref:STAS domain-containing protein n=1 Tax=Streptomyces sp. WAC06614 TaxID=2487416 RepID=UPI000F78528B|nr:STAS domain-containing protein [Streptomyces sp. WAC06614]RSS68504.1 anti-sigma factor antagonist [Streptomyces sp. WAC06614]
MRPELAVHVHTHTDTTVVTVTGELDLDTCPRVTEVTDAVPVSGRVLALDLSGVTFMDSTGLNMLLALRERVRSDGGRLELLGVRRQALHVMDLTGSRHLFTLRAAPETGDGVPPQAVERG